MQVGAVRLEPSAPLAGSRRRCRRPTSRASRAAGARRRCAGGSRSPSGCDAATTSSSSPRSDARRARSRRRGGGAARPRGRSARPQRSACSSWRAAAPRSSPPRRRRRGAAPVAARSQSISATGRPSRKITFGGKMSLWQTTVAATRGGARRLECHSCQSGGGTKPAWASCIRRSSAPELAQDVVVRPARGASAGSPSTNESTSPSALVEAERRAALRRSRPLEVPQERVDRVGVRADGPAHRVADAHDDVLADVDVAADERRLVQRGSPPSSCLAHERSMRSSASWSQPPHLLGLEHRAHRLPHRLARVGPDLGVREQLQPRERPGAEVVVRAAGAPVLVRVGAVGGRDRTTDPASR